MALFLLLSVVQNARSKFSRTSRKLPGADDDSSDDSLPVDENRPDTLSDFRRSEHSYLPPQEQDLSPLNPFIEADAEADVDEEVGHIQDGDREESKEEEQGGEESHPGNVILGEQVQFDAGFEEDTIRNTAEFIEFKVDHIHALMEDCIKTRFAEDLLVDAADVKEACVGVSFQALFQNYQESMRKLKEILLELLRLKFEPLDESFEETIDFFVDLLEDFMDKDLALPVSLQLAARSAKYFVDTGKFSQLVRLSAPEVEAFDALHTRLREARNKIQKLLEDQAKVASKYEASLQREAEAEEPEGDEASNEDDSGEEEKEHSEKEEGSEEDEGAADSEYAQKSYEDPEPKDSSYSVAAGGSAHSSGFGGEAESEEPQDDARRRLRSTGQRKLLTFQNRNANASKNSNSGNQKAQLVKKIAHN